MRMFGEILIAIAGLLFAAPAIAQAPPGAVSRPTFQSNLATDFPDNTSGFITPADLRTALIQFSNSTFFWLSDNAPFPPIEAYSVLCNASAIVADPIACTTLPTALIIPNPNITGSLTITPLTGYVYANGSSVATASTTIPLTAFASEAANTVLGAISIGSPVALSMPSCSTSSSALQWATGTGFGCATISGSGGVSGPVSSTNNAIATWNGTGGSALLNTLDTISTGGTLSINPTAASTTQGIVITQSAPATFSGTGPLILNQISATSGTDDTATDNRIMLLKSQFTIGGFSAAAPEGFYNGFFQINVGTTATGITGNIVPLVGFAYSSVATGSGSGLFGMNAVAECDATCTVGDLVGIESDVYDISGATTTNVAAFRAVRAGTGTGSAIDGVLVVDSSLGTFNHLIEIAEEFGTFPISSTGDILYSDHSGTIGSVLNIPTLTISNYIINSQNFTLAGNGDLASAGNLVATGGAVVNAQAGYYGNTANITTQVAGSIGEIVSNSTTNVSVTSAIPKTVLSLTIPSAGHWMCWGAVVTIPASGTTTQIADGSLSLVNNTVGAIPGRSYLPFAAPANDNVIVSFGPQSFNTTGSTTLYAIASMTFAISTMQVDPFLQCERAW